jgi:hypothetical protein
MSIGKPSAVLTAALATVPVTFRDRLIKTYLELKKNSAESRHDAAGLSAGKLCEIILRLLQQKIFGAYTPFGTKINNYADECRRLVAAPATAGNESERVVIPRALSFLYTLRNKRGIGHVGGDVDANGIDAAAMTRTADWIVCELIRINHGLSLEEAQDIVDGLSVRSLPAIWEVAGKKVLLEDLCSWVEYSNPQVFKHSVIKTLHKQRFLEYDEDSDSVVLSPKGIEHVEGKLI